jgi:hypothetical protein
LTECGDATLKLCDNQCKNPEFKYYSTRSNICYNKKELADAGTGPCNTWCTNNLTYGIGCGDNFVK